MKRFKLNILLLSVFTLVACNNSNHKTLKTSQKADTSSYPTVTTVEGVWISNIRNESYKKNRSAQSKINNFNPLSIFGSRGNKKKKQYESMTVPPGLTTIKLEIYKSNRRMSQNIQFNLEARQKYVIKYEFTEDNQVRLWVENKESGKTITMNKIAATFINE